MAVVVAVISMATADDKKRHKTPTATVATIPPGQECSGLWLTGALKWKLDHGCMGQAAGAGVRR